MFTKHAAEVRSARLLPVKTGSKFERVNQGKEKTQTTKQQLKDAKIALLKKDYEHGTIDVMDYLVKLSEFIIHYDD